MEKRYYSDKQVDCDAPHPVAFCYCNAYVYDPVDNKCYDHDDLKAEIADIYDDPAMVADGCFMRDMIGCIKDSNEARADMLDWVQMFLYNSIQPEIDMAA